MLYWSFDEGSGTTAYDSSDKGNHGTLESKTFSGGTPILPQRVPGIRGNALNFNDFAQEWYQYCYTIYEPVQQEICDPGYWIGAYDYVIQKNLSFFPASGLTVAFWIKTRDKNDGIISFASKGSPDEFLIYDSENLKVRVNGRSGPSSYIRVNDGQWHFVAVTWRSQKGYDKYGNLENTGMLKIYKDAVLQYGQYVSKEKNTSTLGSFVIGQDQDSYGGGFQTTSDLNGTLDEIRVYSFVMDQDGINDLFYFESFPTTGGSYELGAQCGYCGRSRRDCNGCFISDWYCEGNKSCGIGGWKCENGKYYTCTSSCDWQLSGTNSDGDFWDLECGDNA